MSFSRGKPTAKGGWVYPQGQGMPRPYEKPSPEVQQELDKLKRLECSTIAKFKYGLEEEKNNGSTAG